MKNKKPTFTSPIPPEHPPINVAIPNTIGKKMEAIVALSVAVQEISKALNSVHIVATIQGNVIHSAKAGISIGTEPNL